VLYKDQGGRYGLLDRPLARTGARDLSYGFVERPAPLQLPRLAE